MADDDNYVARIVSCRHSARSTVTTVVVLGRTLLVVATTLLLSKAPAMKSGAQPRIMTVVDVFTPTPADPIIRLPALLRLPTVLLAFAHSQPSPTTVRNFVSRSHDGGASWSQQKILLVPDGYMINGPVYDDTTKTLFLFFTLCFAAHAPKRCLPCQRAFLTSSDDGQSWSNLTNLSDPATQGFGLTHGIMSSKGRLIFSSRHGWCRDGCGDATKGQDTIIFSDDHGATWEAGAETATGWTESSVAELRNGSLLLASRQYGHGRSTRPSHAFARSDDGGASWSQSWPWQGPGSNCQSSLISEPDRSALYFATPHLPADEVTADIRRNLTVYTSTDGGLDWQAVAVVYDGLSAYSDMAVLAAAPSMGMAPSSRSSLGVLFERGVHGKQYTSVGFTVVAVP